jgi:coenzyme F420-0:L-glutamate ligase/coenzyme F420-1:gamma-L-glutamate ligase
MAKTLSLIGLENFPMVRLGDNLAELIITTMKREGLAIENGDVIVIAHKVVSKAEGAIIRLKDVKPSKKAEEIAKVTLRDPKLVELILRETKNIVKATPEILIVENRQGLVCVNAGVDKSNVEGEDAYALLPKDPDESARRVRSEIKKLAAKIVAVVITDTYSRPFRRGQVEFAIGLAGIDAFRDYRGQKDLCGQVLKVKNTAAADEIASAAELIMGQGVEGVPVMIIKNLSGVTQKENVSSTDLLISKDEDLFKNTL